MSKFVGGRKGPAINLEKKVDSGIYSLADQYQGSRLSGWDGGNVATGGIISDYTEPNGDIYRAHLFVSDGTFTVTSVDPNPEYATIEVLVVGSGGAGSGTVPGYWQGAGGGGGGVVEVTEYPVASSPGSYPITVGTGGWAGERGANSSDPTGAGGRGSDTIFTNPSSPLTITAKGGGGGGGSGPAVPYGLQKGQYGGSSGGSGASGNSSTTGTPTWAASEGFGASTTPEFATQDTANTSYPSPENLRQYGHFGGWGDSTTTGESGGGGGAAGKGTDSNPPLSATAGSNLGGRGIHSYWSWGKAGIAFTCSRGGDTGPATGGGGGGGHQGDSRQAGTGNDQYSIWGGGGCGGGNPPSGEAGGQGGTGGVIVRYRIGTSKTGIAKASGGAISFYNGKTIHTFISPGQFIAPSTFSETVEYVVIGGGGAGGWDIGGGGAAGGFRAGTHPLSGPDISAVNIGMGGKNFIQPDDNRDLHVGGASLWNCPGGGFQAPGGGAGGIPSSPVEDGQAGASGGGGRGNRGSSGGGGTGNNKPAPATPSPSPSNGWGNDGGGGTSGYGGGGGGGAGGGGQNSGDNTEKGGNGGLGLQLPSTFQDPMSTVGYAGPGPSGYWFAGGGGGGGWSSSSPSGTNIGGRGGAGPSGGNDYAGAGKGPPGPATHPGSWALHNSGSGGGGGSGSAPRNGGAGGPGIILLAYPT